MPNIPEEDQFLTAKSAAQETNIESWLAGKAAKARAPKAETPVITPPVKPETAPQTSFLGQLMSEVWEGVKATPETALSLATGTMAWPISLLGGVGMTVAKGAEEGKAFEQFLQEKYTYQPKGQKSQESMELVGKGMEALNAPANWVGELYGKLSGSPEGQFYVTKTGEVATLFLLPKAKGAAKKVLGKGPKAEAPALDLATAESELQMGRDAARVRKEGRAPGDAAALYQKETMAGEQAKAENARIMEDLNKRAHEEIQSALERIPEEEWGKYVDTGKAIDMEDMAGVIRRGIDRLEEAAKETPQLPEVYRRVIEKEKAELQARADNLKALAEEADQAGAELIVVPEALSPRETIRFGESPEATVKRPYQESPTIIGEKPPTDFTDWIAEEKKAQSMGSEVEAAWSKPGFLRTAEEVALLNRNGVVIPPSRAFMDAILGKLREERGSISFKPKAGDFVDFIDDTGKQQKGKVRDFDSTAGKVWIFPADRSIVKDRNAAIVEVPLDRTFENGTFEAMTRKTGAGDIPAEKTPRPESRILYHGSPTKFDQFEIGKVSPRDPSGKHVSAVISLTDDKAYAKRHAGKSGTVGEYSVDLKNPIDLGNGDATSTVSSFLKKINSPKTAEELGLNPTGWTTQWEMVSYNPEVVKILKEQGYDGVIWKENKGKSTTYSVFYPEQIKKHSGEIPTGKAPEPAGGIKAGQKLGPEYVYHNTKSEYLPEIEKAGFDQGSFSDRPIDYGGDVWIAVKKSDLPKLQTHQVEGKTWYEPSFEAGALPKEKIILVDKKGRVIRSFEQSPPPSGGGVMLSPSEIANLESFRKFSEIARDLNKILGEKGEVLGNAPLSPEKAEAYARLKKDFSVIVRNAKRTGKTLENYLLDLGIDKEIVQYMAREAQGGQKKEQATQMPSGPLTPSPEGPQPDIRVNLNRIIANEDVKQIIAEVNRDQIESGRIEETTRGVVSNAETRQKAQALLKSGKMNLDRLLNRKPGELWNEAELTAARTFPVTLATKLTELNERFKAGDRVAGEQMKPLLAVLGEAEAQITGAKAEPARITQSASIDVGESRIPFDRKRLSDFIDGLDRSGATPETISGMLDTLVTPEQKIGFGRRLWNAGKMAGHILIEAWIANLIGPISHAANISGNTLMLGLAVMERQIAEISGRFGKTPGVEVGETVAHLRGITASFLDSVKLAGKALKEGDQGGPGTKQDFKRSFTPENIGIVDPESSWYKAVKFSSDVTYLNYHFLGAEDAVFKGLAKGAEIYSLAVRKAKWEGLKGSALEKRIADLRDNPTQSMIQAAEEYAAKITFTDPSGPLASAFTNLVGKVPIARLIFPFIKTPTRIFYSATEHLPLINLALDQYNQEISTPGPTRDLAIAKMATGAMTAITAIQLASAGIITGGGPEDPKLRKIWLDAGNQPYSIRIGEKYYQYNRFDYLGSLLGFYADAVNIHNRMNDMEWYQFAFLPIAAYAKNFSSKTFMTGFSDFIDFMESPAKKWESYSKKLGGSLVPTLFSNVAQAVDPTVREVNGLVDKWKSRTPGLSKTLPPDRDFFGEPIFREGGWALAISPVKVKTERDDPVLNEILEQGIPLSMPAKVMGGYTPSKDPLAQERTAWGVKLEPEEYDRYVVLARSEVKIGGLNLHDRLEQLIDSPSYQRQTEGPDGGRALQIRTWVHAYDQIARQQLLKEFPDLAVKVQKRQDARIESLTGMKRK